MADAQTPAQPVDEQLCKRLAALGWQQLVCPVCGGEHARGYPHPDRAVMQQALNALRAVRSNMLQNDPYLSGKAWGDADAAIAALEKSLAP